MEALLTATDLTKSFGETRALKGVQLEIARGEIVGLVGENGAGKSTLVSILGGHLETDSGEMVLDDEPYRPESPAEALTLGVGSIQQQFEVDAEHTIAHNIYRNTIHADLSEDEQHEMARELLESVSLDFDPGRRMGDLVRAEQSLIEVLRLMAEETQLVLIDEVSATFNDYEIAQLHEVTRRLARQGRAIVYITHRIDEIASLVHRVVVLRDGFVTRGFQPRAMPVADIAYEITERDLTFGARPRAVEAADTRLFVEHLSTPDGSVDDVSLALQRGEVFGLTGLRRAGMSELAAALVGAMPATWSTFHKDGEDIELNSPTDAVQRRIGYLSDSDDALGLQTEQSIADNLLEGRETGSVLDDFNALSEAIGQVWRLRIDAAGSGTKVGELSVGNQQKVAVARLMGAGFDVLVLNHPTRGIDVGARRDITEMLHELTSKGTSIIFVSSDMSELLELSHRIGVMRDGRLISVQSNDEANEDTLMTAALGEAFDDDTVGKARGQRRS